MKSVRLSVVVVAYNMERELPKTLLSLSPSMQRDVDEDDYEIIVVDNGSTPPVGVEAGGLATVLHMVNPRPSPAAAINRGLASATGDLIGVMVDGARLVSPGILRGALMAARLHPRPIISTLGFHLGPKVQMQSVSEGYDRKAEDALLASSGWEEDGYRLFGVSALAGSSADGWFLPMAESNALFMPRELWEELGGYDEAFSSPGGGLVNLDTYKRCSSLSQSQLIVLLGEGTFHQVHGGIATNAAASPWKAFHDEYVSIRGEAFQRPDVEAIYVGSIDQHVLSSIESSARRALDEEGPAD